MSNEPQRPAQLDPAFWRGLTQGRLSRRDALRYGATGAGALGLSALLAACGVQGTAQTHTATSPTGPGTKSWWAKQTQQGTLNFANWPLYIDSEHGKHPTLQMFTKATGINVKYEEVIQNNAPFYAKISPELQAGKPTGYDLIVMTNGWELTQLIDNGWLIGLDHARMPNFYKYASPLVRNPNYDPNNHYTATWQSGFTGIAYNTKIITEPVTSINDLFNPKYKGHVGMMSDNTELGSVGLLKLGIDPATSTVAQWQKAAKLLETQRPVVRGYYDQSYIQALENGDTWITQAWSGDIYQANASGFPHLKFVTPVEGQMVWHDNMCIPMYAQHPVDAMEWINFYYTPKIAGLVADWVDYVTPVPAARQYIDSVIKDPSVGNSELVFPTSSMMAKSHNYFVYKTFNQFNTWNNIFNPIIQS